MRLFHCKNLKEKVIYAQINYLSSYLFFIVIDLFLLSSFT